MEQNGSLHGSDRLARGLGWLSLGLGVCKLLAPQSLTRPLGIQGAEPLVRACGARSVATGIGALTVNPKPALWAGALGDAMDAASLALLANHQEHPERRNVTRAMLLATTLAALGVYAAQDQTRRHAYQAGPTPDYSGRTGFPRGLEHSRGIAGQASAGSAPQAALPSPAQSPGERLPSQSGSPERSGLHERSGLGRPDSS
ncbi:hypothetical protein [Halomonas sp. E19]|uniref:hypothetical protein n=1 Tax=unclassified Halomonas TaxID=2609666 RepID=UPI004034B34E